MILNVYFLQNLETKHKMLGKGYINTSSPVNCHHVDTIVGNTVIHCYVLSHTVADFISFVKEHLCRQCSNEPWN